MFKNRVLRKIFGPKGEEVAGGWRRLHNEELRNLHSSSNIIRMITSRKMRWAGHVAHVGGVRNSYIILVGNLKGRNHLEGLDVDRKIILKWILWK
jgi:hypothetical protein